jgi:hypothetical protein
MGRRRRPIDDIPEANFPPEPGDEIEQALGMTHAELAEFTPEFIAKLSKERPVYEESNHQSAYESNGVSTGGVIPMWDGAGRAGASTRLRIQRVTMDGTTEDLGYLPKEAGQEALVTRFPRAGVYNVIPVDEFGRGLRPDPYRIVIPEDHPALKAAHAATAAGTPYVPPAAAITPEIIDILRAQIAEANRRADAAMEAMGRMQDQLVSERDKLSQERLSLAVQNTSAAIDTQAQLIDRAQKRDDAMTIQAQQLFQLQQQAMQDAFTRQLALITAQQDSERARSEHSLTMERERIAAEKEEIRRREERDRAEAKEKAESDRQAFEERLQQNQLFFDKLSSIQRKNEDPITALTNTVERLAPMAGVLQNLLGIKGGGEDATPAAPKSLAEVVGGLAQTYLLSQIEMAKVTANMQIASQHQHQLPMHEEEEYEDDEEEADEAGPNQVSAPAAPAVPQNLTMEEVIADRAKDVPPQIQKAARKGLRAIMDDLKKTDPSEWVPKIIAGLQGVPESVVYLRAVGIRTSCLEAGASEDLAARVVATIDNTGLVPFEIPRH